MLGNQDTMVRSGLLEQEGIIGQGMRTQAIPAEGVTTRGCGTYGIFDNQHQDKLQNN